jgi:hypothetical protein
LTAALLALAACSGGEGKSIPTSCPNVPLYSNVEDLTSAERAKYTKAEREGCLTPVGTAVTDPNMRPPPGSGGSGNGPDAGDDAGDAG